MRFNGKVALITGGGKGIGRSIAMALAAEGAGLVINDLDSDAAEGTALRIASGGGRSLAVTADVSIEAGVESMVQKALEHFGRIDFLVNNAGVPDTIVPTVDQKTADWQRVMDVDLRGTYLCSRAVGRHMVRQRSGKIVNIASMAGVVSLPMRNAYSSAKAGVIVFTKSLASEWAKYNITVNTVSPGYIMTSMVAGLIQKRRIAEEPIVRRIPMGRLGQPDEVAQAVLFLLSSAASYITGVNLPVDGGYGAFGSYGDAYNPRTNASNMGGDSK